MTDLAEVAERLQTQDNRITANPIFVVQQKVRIFGMADGYEDGETFLDGEGNEYADYEPPADADATPVGYLDIWEWVQPFFTEVGAERYRLANAHNLGETRVYVVSGYRNHEWATIRDSLMRIQPESRINEHAFDHPENDGGPTICSRCSQAAYALGDLGPCKPRHDVPRCMHTRPLEGPCPRCGSPSTAGHDGKVRP